jgi:multiple sugar transport system substrate-binding protein
MWITGPWNLGNFRQRFPSEFENRWMTAPLPAPDAASPWPGMSLAGGSSLALFRASKHKDLAWQLLEFLSEPAIQARFYALSGDLPPRRAAWDDPAFSRDLKVRAFREQLGRVAPMPRVPEWEQIAQKIAERMEPAIRGRETNARVLGALDADVDRILDKRRWILARRTEGR